MKRSINLREGIVGLLHAVHLYILFIFLNENQFEVSYYFSRLVALFLQFHNFWSISDKACFKNSNEQREHC